ncbi:ABC transporter ATP-binding protein [Tropicimonas sp. IMCC6043]|uniref:ABC transporter ATP-binding protein n=1 Tax=Tropicimonas sp. IMCC6043 TaxID=2510645 RepID=UPI00101DE666|nr:ABC transporter ATP-binding protein [Tropicimonas sp. IMCC6043]RYH11333.1 ABC transporter ATP-binding protein [Tropicimonas sp. IMCC6043]
MSDVELVQVGKNFGAFEAIGEVSLHLNSGELVVFVGPSGCGKSTLLRMICGLETLTRGDIRIGGKSMRDVDASKRGAAMVFQSYALYPHMTVAENIAFPLRMAGIGKADRLEMARKAAAILQLEPLMDRYPRQLSGGQRQRVAIGRAIVREPDVFLFDEPLSNLDAELRVQMRLEITSLHRKLGATMIYVTHDQVEAMTMADRIVVLRDGRIEQVGTPIELFTRPANVFVAGFVGSPRMNLLKGRVVALSEAEAQVEIAGCDAPVPVKVAPGRLRVGDPVTLGVRPEHLTLSEVGPFRAEVTFVERLGTVSLLHAPDHPAGPVIMEFRGLNVPEGGPVRAAPDTAHLHLFDADGIAVGAASEG